MRQLFPLLHRALYFNTAYVGLASKPLMDYRASLEQEFFNEADAYKRNAIARLEASTKTVADFLNAPLSQTFLVHNFSIGVRYCLEYLPKGTRVLTLKEDYPSLLNALEERQLDVTAVPVTVDVETRVQEALRQGHFDVLEISMVNYTTGLKFNMKALEAIKKAHPELLIIVDGTQWVGTEAIDVQNSPIDILVGSGYKWLLAGFSSGYLYCSAFFFERFKLDPTALWERIFVGHFDYLGAASLAFAVQQLQQWDFEQLMIHKHALDAQLQKGLEASGRLWPLTLQREAHSGIFNISGTEEDVANLQKKGVHCSYRGTGIRLSAHFYNTEEEIEQLLQLL